MLQRPRYTAGAKELHNTILTTTRKTALVLRFKQVSRKHLLNKGPLKIPKLRAVSKQIAESRCVIFQQKYVLY